MFRIVCEPSSGSTELYLTEIGSGSLMFVVCLVSVWQRNFETVVCVYGTTVWELLSVIIIIIIIINIIIIIIIGPGSRTRYRDQMTEGTITGSISGRRKKFALLAIFLQTLQPCSAVFKGFQGSLSPKVGLKLFQRDPDQ